MAVALLVCVCVCALPLPLLQLPVQPGQSQLVGVLLGEEGPGDLLRGLLVELALGHQVDLLVLRPAQAT